MVVSSMYKRMASDTYEFVVLEVTNDLLRKGLSTLFEGLNLIGAGLLELRLDRLHVVLKVGEVGLLVELGRLETERVDDVVDGDGTLLEGLLTLLRRRVGTCGLWLAYYMGS